MKEILVSNTETPIEIDRELACKIGLKETILLQAVNDHLDQDHAYIFSDKLNSLLPFMANKVINSKLNKLINLHYLELVELSAEEKKQILINKNIQGCGIGEHICEWCGCKTIILHEHHFPIPRRLLGIATVNVCGTCHYEYHHLESLKVVKKVKA